MGRGTWDVGRGTWDVGRGIMCWDLNKLKKAGVNTGLFKEIPVKD